MSLSVKFYSAFENEKYIKQNPMQLGFQADFNSGVDPFSYNHDLGVLCH